MLATREKYLHGLRKSEKAKAYSGLLMVQSKKATFKQMNSSKVGMFSPTKTLTLASSLKA